MSEHDEQARTGDPGILSLSSDTKPDRIALNYTVIAQNAEEVQNVENSPAISMAGYLACREQVGRLPTVSVYAERGADRDCIRLLYMNAAALRIWKEIGMHPTEVGMRHRPTRTAVLAFGMPFSE